MHANETVLVALSPTLLLRAKARADQEKRHVDDLVQEALERYVNSDFEWEQTLRRLRVSAHAIGIRNEEDLERATHDWRREEREKAG